MRIGGYALVGILALFLAVLCAPSALATDPGCSILLPNGPEADWDCDGVPDVFDNCPGVPNSDQLDSNRNGLGDMCDTFIEEVVVQPDGHLRQGEFGHLIIRIVNNRGETMRDIAFTVRNAKLGIDAQSSVADLPPGAGTAIDMWLRVPKCATPGAYDLSLTLAQRGVSDVSGAEVRQHRITVERGTACTTPDSPLDTSIIGVFDEVRMDRGESRIIPIRIMNLGEDQVTYDLTVTGVTAWGTWRIDPSQRLTIPAGHDATANLYLTSETGAASGTETMTVRVTADKRSTDIPVKIIIRAPIATPAREGPSFGTFIFWGLILPLLILLLIGAILVALLRAKAKRPRDPTPASVTPPPVRAVRKRPKKRVAIEDSDEKDRFETNY